MANETNSINFDTEQVATLMNNLETTFTNFADELKEINDYVETMINASPTDSAIYGNYGNILFQIWDANASTFGDFHSNFESWAAAVAVISNTNQDFIVETDALYRDKGSTLAGVSEARALISEYGRTGVSIDNLDSDTQSVFNNVSQVAASSNKKTLDNGTTVTVISGTDPSTDYNYNIYYDEDGNYLYREDIAEDGSYYYNENGELIAYNNEPTVSKVDGFTVTSSVDSDGNTTEVKINSDGKAIRQTVTSDDGTKIYEMYTNTDGTYVENEYTDVDNYTRTEYDSDGNVSKINTYTDGDISSMKVYNADGTSSTTSYDDTSTTIVNFDANEKVISEKKVYKDGSSAVQEYTSSGIEFYTYDSGGNETSHNTAINT